MTAKTTLEERPSRRSALTWEGTRVLVTGAGGFIGSHLVERLVARGAHVRAFVRYNSRNDPGLLRHARLDRASHEVMMGDLKDPDTVRRAARDVEVIFHLGALVAIPFSYQAPLDFVQTNVLGTAHVLAAALETGVKRLVHTSTSEVYGTAEYTPIDERHPLQGQSPYSASKIAADKLAESFFRSYGLPVATIRPFNTYGPRQSARAVIPTIISQAVIGNVIRLGATHPTRDFTYVEDLVEAFMSVAEEEHLIGRVINIGSGLEITVEDLVKLVSEMMDKELRIDVEEQRIRPVRSEVERLIADARQARAILGWYPQVSFREGLRATAAWIRDHIESYRPGDYII